MPKSQYCAVMTTTGSESEADQLARVLVSEQLAACVQILPITSYYTWQASLHRDPEWLLLVKTRSDLYPQIEAIILKHHSYEVPEIIQLPVKRGHQAYLQWVDEVTSAGD